MNFELSEDQKLLQEMIREFAQKEILPHVKHMEDNHIFPKLLLQKLGEIGVLGMAIPSEYGGIKTDSLSTALVIEEISRVFPSLAVIVSVHCSLFSNSILQFGNEGQKRRYLPKAASGEIVGAFSLTEPGAGSDATNLKTKARRDGEFYMLNGTKSWVTTGNDAEAFILFALAYTPPGIACFADCRSDPGELPHPQGKYAGRGRAGRCHCIPRTGQLENRDRCSIRGPFSESG
jgi:alkylation response protein AidB-like acyl-CoA dehydrogenase